MGKLAKEIDLNWVKINDPFWSMYQNLVIDTVIPFQEQILEDKVEGAAKSHAIENFKIAAGVKDGEFYGLLWQDSDVAKWIESAAYSLAIKPNHELASRLDHLIDIIEKAQCEDGYLNTFITTTCPEKRWKNLQEGHELYCAGHMMEAAVAYYKATGKDKLLKLMEHFADCIANQFGEGKQYGIPGHQEIEIALLRMYEVTKSKKYKDLAAYFLKARGQNPNFFQEEEEQRGYRLFPHCDMNPYYNQSYAPVYDQKDAVGHSVRATYMYTAMADYGGIENDQRMIDACKILWNDIVNKKMYITGGIGSTVEYEGFTVGYDLPNDTIYAETCASIGLAFFARKMLELEADSKISDVLEQVLYNGTISGMQMDGKGFFYVNPLEVNPGISGQVSGYKHVKTTRPKWFGCACCPPNLARMIASLGSFSWGEGDNILFSHLFVGQELITEKMNITVDSRFPWEGDVSYRIHPSTHDEFTIAIRIPGYAKDLRVVLNKEAFDYEIKSGYMYIKRKWEDSDEIRLTFSMPPRRIYANQKVRQNVGQVAIMRGPLVYCFEGADNGDHLQSFIIPRGNEIFETYDSTLFSSIFLHVKAMKQYSNTEMLYSEQPPVTEEKMLIAIPYFLWGNRGETQMRVWMREDSK